MNRSMLLYMVLFCREMLPRAVTRETECLVRVVGKTTRVVMPSRNRLYAGEGTNKHYKINLIVLRSKAGIFFLIVFFV